MMKSILVVAGCAILLCGGFAWGSPPEGVTCAATLVLQPLSLIHFGTTRTVDLREYLAEHLGDMWFTAPNGRYRLIEIRDIQWPAPNQPVLTIAP